MKIWTKWTVFLSDGTEYNFEMELLSPDSNTEQMKLSITITNYIRGNVFHLPLFYCRSAIYLWLKLYTSLGYLMASKCSKVTFRKLSDSFHSLCGFSFLVNEPGSIKRQVPSIS